MSQWSRVRGSVLGVRRRVSVVDPLSRWWFSLPSWGRALAVLGALIFAVLYPTQLSPYWQNVLFSRVGIFVLLALGLNVVVGQAGLLDLGYVAFYAVGAYTAAKLTTAAGWDPWLAVPAAIALAMVAGVILGAPTLRLRGDYLAIVTLGFGEIVRIIAQNSNALGEARGISGLPHPAPVLGATFGVKPLPYYYLTLAAILVSLVVLIRLRRSRVGRAWAAVREDEDAAELMGVDAFAMKLWAFAIGASTGGLAGWIYASSNNFINPDLFPLLLSITILAAVVLGGMGSVPGVITGGFAVAFLPEYLRSAAAGETVADWLHAVIGGPPADINEYRILLFGAALVAMMVFRPQGLLPSRQRAAELAEAVPEQSLAVRTDVPQEEIELGPEEEGDTGFEAPGPPSVASVGQPLAARPVRNPTSPQAPADSADTVLELTDLTMEFGGVVALDEVSLTVPRGQIFGIIGPNGAGKTTLFNCVTGVFRPTSGSILLEGRSILGLKSHRITESGVARTFQNIRLFPNMTAMENVQVGADARHKTSVPGALLGLPRHRREEREGREVAATLLEFVGIGGRRHAVARNLPYGDQRRLEVARAMATGPSLLLLDEPAAGMNPSEKRALSQLVRDIRDSGLTVVLIEHDVGLVMNLCDQVAVLDFGEKIAEGLPAEIQSNERVIQAYLGVPADAP